MGGERHTPQCEPLPGKAQLEMIEEKFSLEIDRIYVSENAWHMMNK